MHPARLMAALLTGSVTGAEDEHAGTGMQDRLLLPGHREIAVLYSYWALVAVAHGLAAALCGSENES